MSSLEMFENNNETSVVENVKLNNGENMENNNINRREILFLYDITNGNPNGDPLEENMPRVDEVTDINLVTDVRLKRTIRDYLHEYKGYDLFVSELRDENDNVLDCKTRVEDYLPKDYKSKTKKGEYKKLLKDTVLSKCIDTRMFGAVITLGDGSVNFQGPVQFNNANSLNKVEVKHIKGTGAFASDKGKGQKTFRDEYILPYSLINFYGIVNETNAFKTGMTDEDVDVLMDGIWNGTKNLITRSKFGQLPRILLSVEYNTKGYHIGDLNNKISIDYECSDSKNIRSINDLSINIDVLLNALLENKNKIECIHYKIDSSVNFSNYENFNEVIKFLEDNGICVNELDI